jgi:hypothetical protein
MATRFSPRGLPRRLGVIAAILALFVQTLAVALAPAPAFAAIGGEGAWVLCHGGEADTPARPDHDKSVPCDLCPVCFGAAHAIMGAPPLPTVKPPASIVFAMVTPSRQRIAGKAIREAASARAPPGFPATV